MVFRDNSDPEKSSLPQRILHQRLSGQLILRAKELRSQMTPEETRLWKALQHNQLGGYHFRRQQILHGYIADFYCHKAQLVVEVDGGIHTETIAYDQERDQAMVALGLRVLRFSNEEIHTHLPQVLSKILSACQIA